VLLALSRPREALAELKVLEHMVPDESNVHFMLGRVYKTLHDKSSAVKYFTIAMNLDPKVSENYVRTVWIPSINVSLIGATVHQGGHGDVG